jgi:hypothetical protein
MPPVDAKDTLVFVQEMICTITYAMNRQIQIGERCGVHLFVVFEVLIFVFMYVCYTVVFRIFCIRLQVNSRCS